MSKKESLRRQVEEAKSKISAALKNDKKISTELKVAIESILLVIDVLFAVFLEKKTRKTSGNSGLPPSKGFGSNGNRNKGTGKKSPKSNNLKNIESKEKKKTVSAKNCSGCGKSLRSASVKRAEERRKIDIIYKVEILTVTSEVKTCPSCGEETKGVFPKDMPGKLQYGNGIKASVIDFLCAQMLSLERIQEHFKGILGRVISQAVMLKYIVQFSESLEGWEERMITKLLRLPSIYTDETSMRVDKKNHWIHSYSGEDITLKFIHPKRGSAAIEDIGILPRYKGIAVHDCYSSYFTYEEVTHALCGAHLLRELKFIEESTKKKWATDMKKLLQGAASTVYKREKLRVLRKKELENLESAYDDILSGAKKQLSPFPEPTGKRGRPKHTDAQNLYLRLTEHKDSILLFAKNKDVDFTNNRAERDLRVAKLKQKVSGCFRKLEYARHFCRISSYIKTMRYKGYSSLESIMLALEGKIPE